MKMEVEVPCKTPLYNKLLEKTTCDDRLRWHMKQFSTREDAIAKVMEPCKDWAEALYKTELKLAEAMELLREYNSIGKEIIATIKE